jgi:hypothetical protein
MFVTAGSSTFEINTYSLTCMQTYRVSDGFEPRSVHVGSVVDKVTLGQVYLQSTSAFPCQYHSTIDPYSYFIHQHHIPFATDVLRKTISPPPPNFLSGGI